MKKSTVILLLGIYMLLALYISAYIYNETLAHIYPYTEKKDISYLMDKEHLSDEDYKVIFEQTGLGRSAAESIDIKTLGEYQEAYFADIGYECIPNSPVSSEEYVEEPVMKLVPLEKGDILFTRSSHVFTWRNGHAAVVIDENGGYTAEALVIGKNSSVQKISRWRHYPNICVLRLKGASKEERAVIAERAEELVDIPYDLFAGIFGRKYTEEVTGTQCAHLVWSAYASFGYDIDSDGGLIVTPNDIAQSDLLEVVQIYGM